jgi:nitrogen fixation/metabolism regulation signal transduction histidine kinase
MLRQALTNLLQNAADAVAMREAAEREAPNRAAEGRTGEGHAGDGNSVDGRAADGHPGAGQLGEPRPGEGRWGDRQQGADDPIGEQPGKNGPGAGRPGGGHIALTVQDLPDGAVISVADNGIGLPEEDRSRLTEPYVTHKPKGTGLGLAIVKKIMEDHGGILTLEDRPDGRGAVARLMLHRKLAPASAGAPASGAEMRQLSHGA